MATKEGRVPKVKTTADERAGWEWTSVPVASSPRGFAEVPFPWQEAKSEALKAQQAVSQGRMKPKTRAEAAAEAATLVRATETPRPPSRPVTPPRAPAAAPASSLADLAARADHPRASHKDRFGEVYDLLLRPRRDEALQIVELTGADETALAGVQLWLDFFPRARVHALAAAPLQAGADRLALHAVDADDPAGLAALAGALPAPDLVVDAGTHASHHQQNAFLALFPRLVPGGLYVIESLRRQPETIERPGITRTADLFRGFSESRRFHHADPATEAAFAALAGQISGCFLFQVNWDRKRRDQLAVIQKR